MDRKWERSVSELCSVELRLLLLRPNNGLKAPLSDDRFIVISRLELAGFRRGSTSHRHRSELERLGMVPLRGCRTSAPEMHRRDPLIPRIPKFLSVTFLYVDMRVCVCLCYINVS